MNKASSGIKVSLKINQTLIPRLHMLLNQGVEVDIFRPSSIESFLRQTLQIPADYIENRIQTLFVDGKPVDNLKTACLKPGETLALSAAMPGVAGAILRKGGPLSPMREQISFGDGGSFSTRMQGRIKLKLFNFLAREIGLDLLKQGVWVTGRIWEDLVHKEQTAFIEGCEAAAVNDASIPVAALVDYPWSDKDVFLKIEI